MTAQRRVVEIPLDLIDIPKRLREVDPLQVEALKESIAERGLLAPIVVTAPDTQGKHTLIAGMHRYRAAQVLGWRKIEAFVHEVTDPDHARLIEIEENLVRHDLNHLDRAVFLAEWKRIYSGMMGARGPGRPKNADTMSEFPLRFSEAVKERLKLTPRSVDRAIKRAAITERLRRALTGHLVTENANILDLIAKLTVEKQETLAAEMTPDWGVADVRRRANEMLGRGAPEEPNYAARIVALAGRLSLDQLGQVIRDLQRLAKSRKGETE